MSGQKIVFRFGEQTWELPIGVVAFRIANKYAHSFPEMDVIYDKVINDQSYLLSEMVKLDWVELKDYVFLVGQPTHDDFQKALKNKEFSIEG